MGVPPTKVHEPSAHTSSFCRQKLDLLESNSILKKQNDVLCSTWPNSMALSECVRTEKRVYRIFNTRFQGVAILG